jgi:hypothetical protein
VLVQVVLTSKGGDIFVDPMKCQALILDADICEAILHDVVSVQETEGSESIGNGNADDGFLNLNRILYDE